MAAVCAGQNTGCKHRLVVTFTSSDVLTDEELQGACAALKAKLERFFTAASELQCQASPAGSSAGRRLLQTTGESQDEVALTVSMPMANAQPQLLATIANTDPGGVSLLLAAESG